jgi:hypothetical protein
MAYPFKKLHFNASWTKQHFDDRGEAYVEAQTFTVLTRLPTLYKDPSFDLLVKLTKSTSLHVHLSRNGWVLASIDEPSLRVISLN